jgi:hypothetical protein
MLAAAGGAVKLTDPRPLMACFPGDCGTPPPIPSHRVIALIPTPTASFLPPAVPSTIGCVPLLILRPGRAILF